MFDCVRLERNLEILDGEVVHIHTKKKKEKKRNFKSADI